MEYMATKTGFPPFRKSATCTTKGKHQTKILGQLRFNEDNGYKSKPIASAWNQGLARISRPLGDRGLHGAKEKIDYYLVTGHGCFEFSNNSVECQS